MFKVEALLQPFKGFLDAPALMIQIANQLGGEFGALPQVGHEHADRARGGDMAHETYLDRRGRTAIIADIGIIRGREGDDEFRTTRAQEGLDTSKPAGLLFDPHAEEDLPHRWVSNAANHRHG